VFKILRERQDNIGKILARGACLEMPVEHHFKYYGSMVGRYNEIEDLLGMDFDDMKLEKSE
jgi:hypothetical protein